MTKEQIIITEEYQQCFDLIDKGAPCLFISGQAGSGKSVLIDQIHKRYHSLNIAKVAPTGVAALNVRGQTIHSIFRLPFGVITADRAHSIASRIMSNPSNKLLSKIDMLIIDEIPMGRADILDAIDIILRRVRFYDYPFGGAQVIMVGDLFQLPPIITDTDRPIFDKLYACEYFFGSNVFDDLLKYNMFNSIMLTSSFRQKDNIFVKILNNIRINAHTEVSLEALNEYCFNNPAEWTQTDDSIVLCTTNKRAVEINGGELMKLTTPAQTYQGELVGRFDIKALLTPQSLTLKVGAKVMFTKNNGDVWVNGTMGIVRCFDSEHGISVYIPSTYNTVWVSQETWENIEYELHDGNIIENVVGSFTQFPLVLAYAVTIHKSQGLTFNYVKLDLGWRAFAAGQTYVGLSRCTTIDGIHLSRPITPNDIIVDQRVVDFYQVLGVSYIAQPEDGENLTIPTP